MPIIVEPSSAPGVGLVLNHLWLNSVADPSDNMAFRTGTFTMTSAVQGEVRTLANGRMRLIRRAGAPKSHSVVIRHPSPDQLDFLLSHVGDLLTLRDPAGGKYHGVYMSLASPRIPSMADDITLSFTEVTHSEAV